MDIRYKIKAAEKARAFLRKHGKEGYTFFTVKHKRPNTIQKVTKDFIYITTEKSSKPNRISREKLTQALSVLFYRRVTTLKKLIKINKYSSAMAGLIKIIMSDICKVREMKNGAMRITLRGVRYFFSGVSKGKSDVRIVKKNGGTFVLLNYFQIRCDLIDSWKYNLRSCGFTEGQCVLLDPGEKTMYELMKKGIPVKPIDLDAYADFVKRHSDVIFQYLTVDVIADPITTRKNTEYLESIVGRKPVPVFHIQNSLDVLQEWINDGYDVIALGGGCFVSRQERELAFDKIFAQFGDQANFHGLAVGSPRMLLKYNWFSCDASSWINGRSKGKLLSFAGDRRSPGWMSGAEAMGFNVRTFAALEDRYTDLQINLDLLPPSFA